MPNCLRRLGRAATGLRDSFADFFNSHELLPCMKSPEAREQRVTLKEMPLYKLNKNTFLKAVVEAPVEPNNNTKDKAAKAERKAKRKVEREAKANAFREAKQVTQLKAQHEEFILKLQTVSLDLVMRATSRAVYQVCKPTFD